MSKAQENRCELLKTNSPQTFDLLNRERSSCILVVEGEKPIGIFTERDALKLAVSQRDLNGITIERVMTRKLITLKRSPNQTIFTALSLLHWHRIHHLPILDERGHLSGLVTPSQIRQVLRPIDLLKLKTVDEMMTTDIVRAPPTASILTIAKLMESHRISCVVITEEVQRREGTEEEIDEPRFRPVGIITERDIVQFQILQLNLSKIQAEEVMSTPLFILPPEDSLWFAQQEMQQRWIRRLVVMGAQGELRGIITQTDLLQAIDPVELLSVVAMLRQQVGEKTTALERANQELQQEMSRRQQAEAEVKQINDGLEMQVQERTAELASANVRLQQEIKERCQAEQQLQETLCLLEFQKYALARAAIVAITDRKQAEENLQENKRRLTTLIDNLPGYVYQVANDSNYTPEFISEGVLEITGYRQEEYLIEHTISCGQDIHPDDRESIWNIVQQAVTAKQPYECEYRIITKSGTQKWVWERGRGIYDENGELSHLEGFVTNITEKKLLEAQFLRAQRLESLGTLASGIAHDLNNILTPILAAAHLLPLKLNNPDRQVQSLLKMSQESAKRGADLVKQILSFARGAEGERTQIQIAHIVTEVVKVARQTFPKSIEINLNLASELWLVSGDATQLHQVLMNLFINARDAMPEGGILTVTAENLQVDESYARMNLDAKIGNYVVITIIDTGIGISEETRERIFEPFFTTKEPGEGTGLGLSTVIGIIKSHQGFINVYSEVGKGTSFNLYLPADENVETTQSVEDLESLKGNGELILVVDDEASVREITKATLENYNYRVIIANDGVDAIALYAQHKDEIAVVLLDLMMPSLDTSTIVRTLERINSEIKIIAMSGLAAIKFKLWRNRIMLQQNRLVNILATLIISCFGLFGWTQLAWGHSLQSSTMVAMESPSSNLVEQRLCTNSGQKIDLNNANTIAFKDCPGFYPTLAKLIVTNGPYQNIEDVLSLEGLSDRQQEMLKANLDSFTVSDPIVSLDLRMPPRPAPRK
jgi:PAS domain S-box-containing protein